MSAENVEIVRAVFAEWERGNFAATGLAPDVRITWLASAFGGGQRETTIGLEEAADFMREFFSSFQDVRLVAEEVVDADDKVVVVAVWRGEGKTSGALTEWRHGGVYEIRDSQVASITTYTDPSTAFEAAGLRDRGTPD